MMKYYSNQSLTTERVVLGVILALAAVGSILGGVYALIEIVVRLTGAP